MTRRAMYTQQTPDSDVRAAIGITIGQWREARAFLGIDLLRAMSEIAGDPATRQPQTVARRRTP